MTAHLDARQGTGTVLRCAGRAVARYVHRPELPPEVSPRPYLHPVRTLGGAVVTELMPVDHLHHLGVSLAVPDVSGANFWGGRTYVRDQGPTELDNHGRQLHLGWRRRTSGHLREDLGWQDRAGRRLLGEERELAARPLSDTAWLLELRSTLHNTSGAPLSLGSPATNGRPGAGYGGWFWRAPATSRDLLVRTADGEGEQAAHGSRSRWLALAGTDPNGLDWTVLLVHDGTDPWFLRVAEYPGVGCSLAWEQRLPVLPGAPVVRRIAAVVADGRLTRAQASALAEDPRLRVVADG
ncbi:PmoA family protein [Peterkaempfera sp. SMS 1(5)a]|uniref:DUF6807 domain-containing protein n=1 Tax=Peterkaempfera podocarpi TaxID=3232308 RepID=UPI00366BA514